MTRRQTHDLERRLDELEEKRARTPDEEFDLSPLSMAEKEALERAFGSDTPEGEGEQVDALIQASHDRLDANRDTPRHE